jgi:hypothetical protein
MIRTGTEVLAGFVVKRGTASNTGACLKNAHGRVANVQIVIGRERIPRRLDVLQKNLTGPVGELADRSNVIGFHTYGKQYNHELVMNALKYASPGRRAGTIRICSALLNGTVVRPEGGDDGAGLQPYLDLGNSEPLGMDPVRNLTEQLDETLAFRSSNGFGATLEIDFSRHHPRHKEPTHV